MIVNPVSGKRERIYVNLEAVYPSPEEPGTELSFEELWAANRGWLDANWDDESIVEDRQPPADENVDLLSQRVATKLVVHHDVVTLDENGAIQEPRKSSKPKKKKTAEVNETQISKLYSVPSLFSFLLTHDAVKAKLDSPSGPKMRKKHSSAEPTMTLHTKAATDDIYDIFNAPLKSSDQQDESDDDAYMTDGDYTSGGESTCTTRQIEMREADDETKSASEWSDVTGRKHMPDVDGGDDEGHDENETQASNLIAFDDDGVDDDEVDGDVDDGEPSGPLTAVIVPNDDGYESITPTSGEFPSTIPTKFVPIPPEDYVAPTRPYRDPAEVANNRLPFMTPITERTESSLGVVTGAKPNFFEARTPCRDDVLDTHAEDEESEEEDDEDFGPLSSPLREVFGERRSPIKVAQPALQKSTAKTVKPVHKGPIIKELQCNPVDAQVRGEILAKMHPPLSSYRGFYDHRNTRCDKGAEIRRFAKALAKNAKNGGSSERSSISNPVTLELPDIQHTYTLKRELGAGAFAPVYLVENSAPDTDGEDEDDDDENGAPLVEMGKGAFAVARRSRLEALKMEQPPTAWEFHMTRLAATRLGPQHRATASITAVHELHLYQDDGFMFLPLHAHGTLLDVVNFFREQASGVMDEPLAMFFAIELLRTVEALHSKQILHGDIKVDNCLLRLDSLASGTHEVSSQWCPNGSGGWGSRGLVLIDFGRAIDMRNFEPDVQFIADWKTTSQDCAEMREGRPWTWQIDYHGLAGVLHTLLFGRYIETVRCDAGGLGTTAGRRYKIRESLKRYWQTDIWSACFDLLLNPGSHAENEEGGRMPIMRGMRDIREQMESWLENNSERGVGLRALMGRVEAYARSRK